MTKDLSFETKSSPRLGSGVIGGVFSALGLAGWLLILAMFVLLPYEDQSSDTLTNLGVFINNILLFFVKVALGLFGLGASGALSIAGTVVSAVALHDQPRERTARMGLALGLVGIAMGAGLLIWRWMVWQTALT